MENILNAALKEAENFLNSHSTVRREHIIKKTDEMLYKFSCRNKPDYKEKLLEIRNRINNWCQEMFKRFKI